MGVTFLNVAFRASCLKDILPKVAFLYTFCDTEHVFVVQTVH